MNYRTNASFNTDTASERSESVYSDDFKRRNTLVKEPTSTSCFCIKKHRKPMDMTKILKKKKNVWIDSLMKKFKEISKSHEGIKEIYNYLRSNKKSFKTVEYYQDFCKKIDRLDSKVVSNQTRDSPKIKSGSYLDEEDIRDMRRDSDSRCSITDTEPSCEEVKVINCTDQEIEGNMREFCMQKGKVRSTYIMAKDDNQSSFITNINGDLDSITSLNARADLYYKVIRHHLGKEDHPIRQIIEQFSSMMVRSYKKFVNKKGVDIKELYKQLEKANQQIFARAENGAELKELHHKKRISERKGRVYESEKIELPTYFIYNQVVSDVKLFIKQMLLATKEFYSIVAKKSDLEDIDEELME